MPTTTPNLGLKKPLGNETVSRSAYNENLDILDENVAKASNLVAHLNNDTPHSSYVPLKTTADLTYYVDTTNGNDSNDGLTAGTALKTIMAAINKIPQVVNHTVTINVAIGTYNETVILAGFSGHGKIDLYGGSHTTCLVNNFILDHCSCEICIDSFRATTTSTHAYNIRACPDVCLYSCDVVEATASYDGVYAYNSYVYLYDCTISNRKNAIYTFGGIVIDDYNDGTGNTYSHRVGYGGIVALVDGPYPGGINGDSVLSGGKIIQGSLSATAGNKTYYVDAVNGNDGNKGTEPGAGNAFKTIGRAIKAIPQVVNDVITINVAPGTYNEAVTIQGFVGKGEIRLYGDTVVSDSYSCTSINITGCAILVSVRGFRATTTSTHAFAVYHCARVQLSYCKVTTTSGSYSGVGAFFSLVQVDNSLLSNRYAGIYASGCATVFSDTNSGSGNTTGLKAVAASKIGKNGTQPGGTTAESATQGSQIL